MATDCLMKKQGGWLIPVDAPSIEALKEVPKGMILRVRWTQPRNLRHHRKFFALIKIIFEAQNFYATQEQLLDAIKIKLGHTSEVKVGRAIHYVPKSISFARMDQREFAQFYNAVVKLTLETILPGVNEQELEEHVLEFLGDQR